MQFVVLATATAALMSPAVGPALRRHPLVRVVPRLDATAGVDADAGAGTVADGETVTDMSTFKGVVVPTKLPQEAPPRIAQYQRAAFLSLGFAALFVASKTTVGTAIGAQVAYEVAHCTQSPAKLFGFAGACCNWFLGLSAVYDAARAGPEIISLPMTFVMLAYSIVFCRWAGWAVMPRNFILAGSHMLNIAAQGNQLRRCLAHKLQTQPGARQEIAALGVKVASALGVITTFVLAAPRLKALMPVGSYLASSGGPFTIHPWPPVTKLFLSLTSLADLQRPTDQISLSQYAALTLTGFIFSFYGLFVTPINYALTAVNILLFSSSAWHLGRKIKACFFTGECEVPEYVGEPY